MGSAAEGTELEDVILAAKQRDIAAERLQISVLRATEAGVSQRNIANALGVTQSAVSQMIAASRVRAKLIQGPVGRKLAEHRAAVIDIARSRGAFRIRVFGSVARGEDTDDSDIDLLVSMPGPLSLFDVTGLSLDLSDLVGAPVDVVPEQLVKRDALTALVASAVTL